MRKQTIDAVNRLADGSVNLSRREKSRLPDVIIEAKERPMTSARR